jgi:hypothetical protein
MDWLNEEERELFNCRMVWLELIAHYELRLQWALTEMHKEYPSKRTEREKLDFLKYKYARHNNVEDIDE